MSTETALALSMHAKAKREVGREKTGIRKRQKAIADQMQRDGVRKLDGIGQKIGGVDPRLYFRWEQHHPGCWRDKGFVQEFLRDNPQCRAPGHVAKTRIRPTWSKTYK